MVDVVPADFFNFQNFAAMKGIEKKPHGTFADTEHFCEVEDSQRRVFRKNDQGLSMTTQEGPRFFTIGHRRSMYIQMPIGK